MLILLLLGSCVVHPPDDPDTDANDAFDVALDLGVRPLACDLSRLGAWFGNQTLGPDDDYELTQLVEGFAYGDFDSVTYHVECPTCLAPVEAHPITVERDGFFRLQLRFRDEYEPGFATTFNTVPGRGEPGVFRVQADGSCSSTCDVFGDPALADPRGWDCDRPDYRW